ncbi:Folate-Biopterin Transporter (FBT) family [Phytophthora nicotianae]|nr:Folate-Biopterin Transporter (FBT) family [Phytophthora nicotianae]
MSLLTKLEPPLGLGTFKATLNSLATEDMKPDEWTALSYAVHRRRRETFHDIEARIAELTYRVRLGLGNCDGLNGNVNTSTNPDLRCPPNMFRFTDLLLVLTMRVLPLESLTVQEKVDELAMRGYAFRHRKAIIIQSSFRMFRVRRRMKSKIRMAKRASEADKLKRIQPKIKEKFTENPTENTTNEVPKQDRVEAVAIEQTSPQAKTSLSLRISLPTLSLPTLSLRGTTPERIRAPATVAPILSEHLELQPEASDGRKCSI